MARVRSRRAAAGVEPRQQHVAGGDRRLAEPADRARARCPAPRRGSRTRRPPATTPRTAYTSRPIASSEARRPVSTTARGSSARSARPSRAGSIDAVSDSVRSPARRSTARAPGRGARRGRRGRWRRRSARRRAREAGGESRFSADSQPVAWRQANSYSAVLGPGSACDRRPPPAGPPRSSARTSAARGSPRAGGWPCSSSKARRRRARRDDGGRALAALAGQRDRGGDVVRLGQRQPQRLDLGERVLAVTAGGTVGPREAVATLPAAQRVGADAEHHRRRVSPDSTHPVGVIGANALRCKGRTKPCTLDGFVHVQGFHARRGAVGRLAPGDLLELRQRNRDGATGAARLRFRWNRAASLDKVVQHLLLEETRWNSRQGATEWQSGVEEIGMQRVAGSLGGSVGISWNRHTAMCARTRHQEVLRCPSATADPPGSRRSDY